MTSILTWTSSGFALPSGRTDRDDCKIVAGSDSCRLRGYSGNIEGLGDLCNELLGLHNKGIPATFEFASRLRPLSSTDARHATLEQNLLRLLQSARFAPANTEIILNAADSDFASAVLRHRGSKEELTYISNEDVWSALSKLRQVNDDILFESLKIDLFDEAGDQLKSLRLLDIIQAELVINRERYLRLDRRWFSVSTRYVKEIGNRVAVLPNLTDALKLPEWDKSVHSEEGDYNRYVSSKKNYLLQDEQFIHLNGAAPIEPCDLLTKEHFYIHVKDGNRASAVHHQLGQLSGAASLLGHHEEFASIMKSRYESYWKNGNSNKAAVSNPTFVLAVGRLPKDRDLFGKMLLPKINVLEHARRVRALGFRFALARIDIVQTGTKPGVKGARPKRPGVRRTKPGPRTAGARTGT